MEASNLNREAILDFMGMGRGSGAGLFIPFEFVRWLGSYESAAMLVQVLFHRDQARKDGREEFYKSYDQWREELHLTERQVRNALKDVCAVGVRTRARRAPNGNRTLFYRLDAEAFLAAWQAFLSRGSVQNVPIETDDPALEAGPGPDAACPPIGTLRTPDLLVTDRSTDSVCEPPATHTVMAAPSNGKHGPIPARATSPTATMAVAPLAVVGTTWEPSPALIAEVDHKGDLAYQVARFRDFHADLPVARAPGVFRAWMRRADPAREPAAKLPPTGGPAPPAPRLVTPSAFEQELARRRAAQKETVSHA